MSKSTPIINRTETGAAIDRAMETLRAMKGQLRAKKLNGRALHSLMDVANQELASIRDPINEQYNADLDATIAIHRALSVSLFGEGEP